MIREVDLMSYLPLFMQGFRERAATLGAEEPEFGLVWAAADRILRNRFISTADEYGIGRLERILGICAQEGEPLELRRLRLQNRWCSSLPYTVRVLADRVAECLKGEHNFTICPDFQDGYWMTLVVYSSDESLTAELWYILSTLVPANIMTEIIYESVTSGLTAYAAGAMEQADIIEIRQR